METYGIVVTCKGRLEHLKRSLPISLSHPDWPLVTVVDYGCPEGTFDWCVSLDHPRLQAIQVLDNTYPFSRTRAKNIGAVRTPTSVLCFVDADCLLDRKWLQCIGESFETGHDICLVDPMVDDASGTYAIRSTLFHGIRGYDESLADWGYEDSDLYIRAYNYGGIVGTYSRDLVKMIQHDNDIRSMYHETKDPDVTWNRNRAISKDPLRGRINPKGYGIARCIVRRS